MFYSSRVSYISLTLLFLLIFTSGCSNSAKTLPAPPQTTFDANIRISRLNLPETPGKHKFDLSLENAKFARIKVTDTRANPGAQTFFYANESDRGMLSSNFGLTEKLSIGLKKEVGLENIKVNTRFQLAGHNKATADKGNFSLSSGIGYLYQRKSKSNGSDRSDCFLFFCDDAEDTTLKTRYHTTGTDIDLLAGYRPHQQVLLYSGWFYQDISYHSTVTYIDRQTNPNKVTGKTRNKQSESANIQGPVIGFAYDLSGRFSLLGEYLQYTIDWNSDTLASKEESYNATVRMHF